jgi:ATP synthase protein I
MNDTPSGQDPWAAYGRIGGGVLVYGAAGYLLDRWLGTSFIVGIGIVVGAGLGLYAVLASLRSH